ncbi:MAG: lamin tail domain-containing protein [Pyrinomonadaceae bacterium MAG19_C2-C3]|nr:lamin tail domain-containing protein [Pyrinomonadaceae bacterium MAG19_C2-C3]
MRFTKFLLLITAVLILNTAAQAQRRPNPDAVPSEILITEFRPSGPNGAKDEYVELYNNTNETLDITGHTIYLYDGDGRTLFISPTSGATSGFAVIPPRGFYLIANFNRSNANATDRYSLNGYAVPNFSTEDLGADVDYFRNAAALPDPGNDAGVRISGLGFGTPDILNGGTFFDRVGFQGREQFAEPFDLVEGTPFNLPTSLPSPAPQYAMVRRFVGGRPVDTNNNVNDFVLVSSAVPVNGFSRMETNGTFPVTPILGAPGPQNTTSPYRGVSNPILAALLDTTRAPNASPNVDRYVNEIGPNASVGTLAFRRRITNSAATDLTNLRFRFTNITTLNTPNQTDGAPQADGRALSSGGRTGIMRTGSDGTQSAVTFTPLILDTPPSSSADGSGGGLNSTLRVVPQNGVTSLGSRSSLDVEFLFGINSPRGTIFRFAVLVETLPAAGATPSSTTAEASSVKPESKTRTGSRIKR